MNTSLPNQGDKTGVGARKRMPAMKVRTVTAGGQPNVTKGACFRETTAEERRRNIAGAPYYRGLHWDF